MLDWELVDSNFERGRFSVSSIFRSLELVRLRDVDIWPFWKIWHVISKKKNWSIWPQTVDVKPGKTFFHRDEKVRCYWDEGTLEGPKSAKNVPQRLQHGRETILHRFEKVRCYRDAGTLDANFRPPISNLTPISISTSNFNFDLHLLCICSF